MDTRSSGFVEARVRCSGHNRHRWGLSVMTLLACVVFGAVGCSTTTVVVPNPDPVTEYRERNTTSQTFFWGLMQDPQTVVAENCESNSLDNVRVSNNFGFALVTVLSLGIWSPIEVNWRCAEAADGGSGEF